MHRGWVIVALIVCCLALVWGLQSKEPRPELAHISAHPEWTFTDVTAYFRTLAREKGAPYAFDVLLEARLPQHIDVHLVGHVIGAILYEQEGAEGIDTCTQDFRNACSHSVVIGAFLDRGEAALDEVAQVCRKAPGGAGAYTMCFHGLGHGVLAYTGYDLPAAVSMCDRTGTSMYQYQESAECVGGTIMEMIDGVHDPQAWEEKRDDTFREEDPLYPCSASFMPNTAKGICYTYLTPHLFTAAGVSMEQFDDVQLSRVFSLCAPLAGNTQLRNACYGGFGKEFVGLVRDRDIRAIGSMSPEELARIRTWCAQAGDTNGEAACNQQALASLFWGGENEPDAAIAFCTLAEGNVRNACYRDLADAVSYYLAGTLKGATVCRELPEDYQRFCRM